MIGGTIVPMAPDPSATFADPQLESAFRRDGYAVVPVLGPDVVADLLGFYWAEVARPDDHGLTVDHMRDDRAVMRRIAARLAPVWEDVVPGLFVDHSAVFCTFVVKHPGIESQMLLHEDQTWVDETRFRSGTMWVPLVDVGPDLDNGGLGVVPGSHRLGVGHSGAGTPNLTAPFATALRERLVRPPMRAGDGLFYDSRALHESPPNLSDAPRVALACGIVPNAADLRYVRATGRRGRRLYAVDANFYVEHSPRSLVVAMPEGYRVLAEFAEDVDLPADLVADVVGVDHPVAAEPVVPWEIHPSEVPPPVLPTRTTDRTVSADVDPGPPEVDPVPGPGVDGWEFVVDAGTAGPVPAPAASSVRAAEPSVPDGTMFVMCAGSRARLHAVGDEATGLVVTVVDSTRVASGVADGPAAVNLDPGQLLDLEPGATYHFWNDGPGPTTFVVGPRAADRPRRRGLGRLLRR